MDRADEMLVALRRVIRAIDLHSKKLAREHGLTAPQILIIKEVLANGPVPVGAVARSINLSHATTTDVIKRLEKKGILVRERSNKDRRQVLVSATKLAETVRDNAIPLLQDQFIRRFERLHDWEQSQLISSLQRISSMMDAEDIDAAPILAIDAPEAAPDQSVD